MRLDNSGRLGIGTSSPAGKLAIASTGNTGSSLEAYSATDGIIPDFQLLKSGSGTIGTLSTTANGEALGQIRFTGIDTANNKRDGAIISVYQDSTATSGTVPAGIRFDTNGTERMRLDSSGNVQVSTGQFTVGTTASTGLQFINDGTFGTIHSADLKFRTAATERMRLDSSGNLTLDPNDVGNKYLSLNTSASGDGHILLNRAGSNKWQITSGTTNALQFYNYTAGSESMRIDSSGNLLVGTTSSTIYGGTTTGINLNPNGPTSFNRASGQAAMFNRISTDGEIVQFRKDGSTVGSIGVAGGDLYISGGSGHAGIRFDTNTLTPAVNGTQTDATVDLGYSSYRYKDAHFSGTVNAANFNTTSDATLKTNVETLTGSLDAVKSLRGVSFDWIENGNSEVGVIAQEVEAVLPDVVSTNDQGIKSVKYGNMVALLIEAMKEQQAQIDELKAQLNS
jgi:hypothetical protein